MVVNDATNQQVKSNVPRFCLNFSFFCFSLVATTTMMMMMMVVVALPCFSLSLLPLLPLSRLIVVFVCLVCVCVSIVDVRMVVSHHHCHVCRRHEIE